MSDGLWVPKDAAAAVAKASEDEAMNVANDKNKDGEDGDLFYTRTKTTPLRKRNVRVSVLSNPSPSSSNYNC
jgi:hypothetical protein